MKHIKVDIQVESSTVTLPIWPGSTADQLVREYEENPTEDNLQAIEGWLRDDISMEIDFYVESFKVIE